MEGESLRDRAALVEAGTRVADVLYFSHKEIHNLISGEEDEKHDFGVQGFHRQR
jgi:hypothetical protein